MIKKLTYEFVKEQIEKEGYILLSKEYINAHAKLKLKCNNEHEYKTNYDNFKQGKRCPYCQHPSKKHSYEYIKEHIEKEGYELLSKEYINANSKLKLKCNKGHKFEIRWNKFQQGQRCVVCFNKNNYKENHNRWKGGGVYAFYDTYAHQIEYAEVVRRNKKDKNILEVKCTYCEKWYVPKRKNVSNRVRALNGNTTGEHHFYCSNECKRSCPIFKKKLYQEGHIKLKNDRPYQREWSQMVKEEANFECEICGSKENLTAHHILPVKTHPHLQADIDNGICLCKNCHKEHGHKDECGYEKLRSLVCQYEV